MNAKNSTLCREKIDINGTPSIVLVSIRSWIVLIPFVCNLNSTYQCNKMEYTCIIWQQYFLWPRMLTLQAMKMFGVARRSNKLLYRWHAPSFNSFWQRSKRTIQTKTKKPSRIFHSFPANSSVWFRGAIIFLKLFKMADETELNTY